MASTGSAAEAPATALTANNLEAFWMPFTANRQFKKAPRLLVGAKGMYYRAADGRQVLDGTAGLWCVNAGHGRQHIADMVAAQIRELDYAPAFQMGHPRAFELAARLRHLHAARPRPRVLHQFRLGIGGDRPQDRARLSPGARRGLALPPDRPRARLSRGEFRRHFGRRHRRQPQAFRHAPDRRRPHPPHPRHRAATPSPAASRSTGRSWPTTSSGSSRCTTPPPSPR